MMDAVDMPRGRQHRAICFRDYLFACTMGNVSGLEA